MNENAIGFERVRWTLIICLSAALLIGLYIVMKPFLSAIAWAAVLTLVTWPLYRRLRAFLSGNRSLSALIMTVSVAALLCLSFIPGAILLTDELSKLSTSLEAHQQSMSPEDRQSKGEEIRDIATKFLDPYLKRLGISGGEVKNVITGLSGDLFSRVTGALSKIFVVLAQIAICFITAFFLYRDGDEIGRELQRGTRRLGGERFARLLKAVEDTVRAAVYGILLTSVVQGVLAGVGYTIFGAPLPILLSLVTMFFSLLPFGTPFVYIPAAIIMVTNGDLWQGLALAAWGIAIVSTVDNITRPLFISHSTRVPLLLLFFGVLGGLMSFGFIGVFLGPVIVSIFHVLWREWLEGSARQVV